jgi:hypothetical protein
MDKAKLFEPRLPTQEVNVPGVGVVTVRGITRFEQMVFSKAANGNVAVFDRKQLAAAMVDPEITEDEAERWMQAATAGEISQVVTIIGELSGTDREVKALQREAFRSLGNDGS